MDHDANDQALQQALEILQVPEKQEQVSYPKLANDQLVNVAPTFVLPNIFFQVSNNKIQVVNETMGVLQEFAADYDLQPGQNLGYAPCTTSQNPNYFSPVYAGGRTFL